MPGDVVLTFASKLNATRTEVWERISSFDGIGREMRPLLRMTVPSHVRRLSSSSVSLGTPLCRSYLLFLGCLPIDYSDLTLIELLDGQGFVEQSPMGTMRLWRHERRILDIAGEPAAVLLVDRLTFQPRFAAWLVTWFVRRFFQHRHAVLCRQFQGDEDYRAPGGNF